MCRVACMTDQTPKAAKAARVDAAAKRATPVGAGVVREALPRDRKEAKGHAAVTKAARAEGLAGGPMAVPAGARGLLRSDVRILP
jgi:hypothetical protein